MRPAAVIYLLCAATLVANCSPGKKQASRQQTALERELAGEMVSVPGGTFRMGDLSGYGDDGARPVHSVTVPAFRLGRHEVTFAQWDACVADGGCNGYTPYDEGWGRGARPVINVSWDDVQSFIDWLNSTTGGNYRLPTEAEWEYAARAGSTTKYSWGNDIRSNRANCDNDDCGDSWDYTAPAGSFPANLWGLYDMRGNVSEWVQDCWHDSYEGAPTDGSAWTSDDCGLRVRRGGGWNTHAWTLDAAIRSFGTSTSSSWGRDNNTGFRLAQAEEPQPITTTSDPLAEMLALGRLYRQGELGLPEDYVQAYKWFDLAAGEGAPAALAERDELAAQMTPVQIEKVQSEASIRKLFEDMVAIPAGTFRMGDLSGKGHDDEQPVRAVTVPAFRLGKYEVTVSQFRAFVEATGYYTDAEQNAGREAGCFSVQSEGNRDWVLGRSWRDPGYPIQDDQPVVCMSWNDAQAFIKWLNEKTGTHYRLPTEAEWEYAARAGSTMEYHFGHSESELCRYANHAPSSTNFPGRIEPCSDGVEYGAAVAGRYQPNDYGLYDMHGNAFEWVQDCWHDSYEGAPTDGSAWTSDDCSLRVSRGGSWFNDAGHLRSAYRAAGSRASRGDIMGFRLAQDKEQQPTTITDERPAEMLALGRLYHQGGSGVPQDYIQAQKWFNMAASQSAHTGDIEVLEAAVTAGADVNARDSRGRTALMHVADKGYTLLASLLLEAQSDVNVSAPDGATALFMATVHGHTGIIELLMKAGAHVSFRGPQGKTPTDVAITRYGDTNTARENGIPLALLALLDGKTWAEAEAERARKRQEAEALIRKLPEDMVSIPGGTFRMGDLSGEGDDDEQPVRSVMVPAFKLGRHEVTFAQWDACVADGGCNGYTSYDFGWGRGKRPVVYVSWDEAQSFIAWVNQKLGVNFRLPTEAEWEYAVRAGSVTAYSWGDDIGSNRANCDGCGSQWDNQQTASVGSFPATAWGLHDMHGNVAEWVQDCWSDSYEGAPADGSARMIGNCSRRVLRGGSWYHNAPGLRSADRGWAIRPFRDDYIGFRLAQDE